jgi:hypothetical protein
MIFRTGHVGKCVLVLFFYLFPHKTYCSPPVNDSTLSVSTPPIQLNGEDHLYRMNYWVSGTFSLVATAADIYAIPTIIKSKQDLTDDEIKGLNRDAFSGFDRWALDLDASKRNDYYKASDYTMPVIVASAGLLMLDKKINKDWARLLMMYYELHALTFSIYNFSFFGPAFQNKLRPVVYYEDWPMDERKGGNQRNSMYSGHTATAAAATFFMVKVYSDYHPEIGNKKYLLYGLAVIPPLAEGYLRVKALAHFPSDAMMGIVIGAACGVIVPSLHRFRDRDISIGLVPTPVGPGVSLSWHPSYKTVSYKDFNLSQDCKMGFR